MTNAIIDINDSGVARPTLLGHGPIRISTGGKIRAGIKVLTKRAAENPTAQDIYERGVADNHSFDEIEHAITQAVPDLKTPLAPKNVAWFTVRPNDFPNPEVARQILEKFGEDRGDGVKRLYRFPVVFPADGWQVVMPHELVVWGTQGKKFWSEYAPDGSVRYCKCYAPVTMDPNGKRVIRVFGGRKTMLRQENGGICQPEGCPEFQARKCNVSGRFIFFIPGIKSVNAFELHTNSFYAMRRAIEQFETLAFMRGGRISGFLDDKQTSFYLTKKLREVPHIDEEGRAVRTAHWIIELEAPIDLTALLRANDDDTALLHANGAAKVLEGPHHESGSGTEDVDVFDANVHDLKNSGITAPDMDARSTSRAPQTSNEKTAVAAKQAGGVQKGRRSTPDEEAGPSAEQVVTAAVEFGIDAARYEIYAVKRWGPGWKLNANGRRRVLEEIERYRNDPEGFVDKIDTELNALRTPT